jgi:hypothetical protein
MIIIVVFLIRLLIVYNFIFFNVSLFFLHTKIS